MLTTKRFYKKQKKERDLLLKEAREIKSSIINEAKEQANTEADKIITSSKEQISNEKMKALTELKNQVASLSIEMSEKVLKSELSDAAKQKEFVSNSLKQSELN
jgi:F-type H+-transporting ATPase subunit b